MLLLHVLPRSDDADLRVSLGLHFAERPPIRTLHTVRLGSMAIDIGPGQTEYEVRDSFVLPTAVDLVSVYPHAHYLGRAVEATATTPDGGQISLLEIPRWDFHWQDQYRFREPLRLPAGTRLDLRWTFANPPADDGAARRVVFGPSSSDEMADLWLEMFAASEAAAPTLAEAGRQHQLRNAEAGHRAHLERLQAAPGPLPAELAAAHFALADNLVQQDRADQAEVELAAALDASPEHTPSLTNLGNLFYASGRVQEAVPLFERAARLRPDDANAHYNLANALLASGRPADALASFDRAAALEPRRAAVWLNRGLALEKLGRTEEQVESFLQAARTDPSSATPHVNLGLTFQSLRMSAEAVLAFEQALHLSPADPRIRGLALGALLDRAEELLAVGVSTDEARDLLQRAVELDRDNQRATALLSRVDG